MVGSTLLHFAYALRTATSLVITCRHERRGSPQRISKNAAASIRPSIRGPFHSQQVWIIRKVRREFRYWGLFPSLRGRENTPRLEFSSARAQLDAGGPG